MRSHFVGQMRDGRPVVCGALLFRLHDQQGFPLAASIAECDAHGWVPDWMGFGHAARASGRTPETVQSMVRQSLADSGHEFARVLRDTLARVWPKVT